MRYWTIREIEKANEDKGGYFFSQDTMNFFRSRVNYPSYCGPGGIYFVTSERYVNRFLGTSLPRCYTIRKFNPETGDIDTVSEFQEFKTRGRAHRQAANLADGN